MREIMVSEQVEATSMIRRIWKIIRALLGFSRVMIASFALAQAGLGAVIALKGIPSLRILILGAVACLAGSYALTALNDTLDVNIDRARFKKLRDFEAFDVGSLLIRHPLAQGIISYRLALSWIISLSLVSIVFTYLIKPWLIVLFLLVAILVTLYSYLNTISYWKLLVVAALVVLGSAAGWLAVAPAQSPAFPLFVLWIFCWEIGGRNIPNDFADVDEDKELGLKTIPVVHGKELASKVSFIFLLFAWAIGLAVVIAAALPLFFTVSSMIAGLLFLLLPGYQLLKNPEPLVAIKLFNYACLYPLTLLVLLLVSL